MSDTAKTIEAILKSYGIFDDGGDYGTSPMTSELTALFHQQWVKGFTQGQRHVLTALQTTLREDSEVRTVVAVAEIVRNKLEDLEEAK